jgi:hypothetical protein
MGGRVLARAEGQAGVDLDSDQPCGQPLARVRAVHHEPAGGDRGQLQRRGADPVGGRHAVDLDPGEAGAGRGAGRPQPGLERVAVGPLAVEQVDPPAQRLGRGLVLDLEHGDAQRLLLEGLEHRRHLGTAGPDARTPELGFCRHVFST